MNINIAADPVRKDEGPAPEVERLGKFGAKVARAVLKDGHRRCAYLCRLTRVLRGKTNQSVAL
jgi:hypothetical protein